MYQHLMVPPGSPFFRRHAVVAAGGNRRVLPAPAAPLRTRAAVPPITPMRPKDALERSQPLYPTLSRRLREQGKVALRVLIGADGLAEKADIAQSSGYERLDQTALATVRAWRYVPGKRVGIAQAMWFNIPMNFVLE